MRAPIAPTACADADFSEKSGLDKVSEKRNKRATSRWETSHLNREGTISQCMLADTTDGELAEW